MLLVKVLMSKIVLVSIRLQTFILKLHFLNCMIVFNIGIKHDFLCIYICCAPREVFQAQVSTPPLGAQQMLMYQKNMFDRYKTFFSLKNFREIASKSYFTCTCNGAQKHVFCECFENAASWAKTNVIATVHFTDG